MLTDAKLDALLPAMPYDCYASPQVTTPSVGIRGTHEEDPKIVEANVKGLSLLFINIV